MQFKSAVTEHGIPLYVLTMPSVESVTTGLLVAVGGRDEKWPRQAGMAHAFEHMVFKGNRRLKTSQTLMAEIEASGGKLNAETDAEYTFFYRIMPSHALGTAIRSLASQVSTSLFRDKDIKSEMKNIVEEIKMYDDRPKHVCEEAFQELIYGSHPLGRSILGSIGSVESFTRKDFIEWRRRFYHPQNYALLVVGKATIKEALSLVNGESFGNDNGNAEEEKVVPMIRQKEKMKVIIRDIKQANIYLGTAIGAAKSVDTKALILYTYMIGGGMSFPLFQEVRDKRGLCYGISAEVNKRSDLSHFYVSLGTDVNRMEEAIGCIEMIIKKHKNNKVLFNKAKDFMLGRMAINFSGPETILRQAALDISCGMTPMSPEEMMKEMRGINLSEVTEAVERYLNPKNFSYAYVVPNGTTING
jgi:predicted Zn-dependent peptidase